MQAAQLARGPGAGGLQEADLHDARVSVSPVQSWALPVFLSFTLMKNFIFAYFAQRFF